MGSVGQSNHLRFEELPLRKGEKLHRYAVFNHSLYQHIGEIHWRGGWRQYVFQADTYCVEDVDIINGKKYILIEYLSKIDMSRGCHKQIDEFIDKLMLDRKNEKVA